MFKYYEYNKSEIYFILHHLNNYKIKELLSVSRSRLNDDFVLKCCDVARAFTFLEYLEQKVISHLFFIKDSVTYTSHKLNISKEKVYYLKRISLKKIIQSLNGS